MCIMNFLTHYNNNIIMYVSFTILVLVVHFQQCLSFIWEYNTDRVKLTDIRSLTLFAGKRTTARRTWPVPQVKCVGGNAGCRARIDVFQCYNRGTDGIDVQWACRTNNLQKGYRLGRTDVNCEGYAYPNDPFVLKGSCGVEYTLYLTQEPDMDFGSGAGTLFTLFIIFSVLVVVGFICCSNVGRNPAYYDEPIQYHNQPHYIHQEHYYTNDAPVEVYRNPPRHITLGLGHTGHHAPIRARSNTASATGFGHTIRR